MYSKKKKALECFSTFVELDHVFWWAAGMWLSPYLISGPMTECLRSMALALALVRLEVDSPLMAKMASPTPSLPSWLTAPPWTTLRTSMPEPSLIALTVIPANTHINTHTHTSTQKHRWTEGWLRLLWMHAKQRDSRPNKHLTVV